MILKIWTFLLPKKCLSTSIIPNKGQVHKNDLLQATCRQDHYSIPTCVDHTKNPKIKRRRRRSLSTVPCRKEEEWPWSERERLFRHTLPTLCFVFDNQRSRTVPKSNVQHLTSGSHPYGKACFTTKTDRDERSLQSQEVRGSLFGYTWCKTIKRRQRDCGFRVGDHVQGHMSSDVCQSGLQEHHAFQWLKGKWTPTVHTGRNGGYRVQRDRTAKV